MYIPMQYVVSNTFWLFIFFDFLREIRKSIPTDVREIPAVIQHVPTKPYEQLLVFR